MILKSRLDKIFRLSENGSNTGTEITAGITTFMTMAYIIVVQPMVLSGRMFGFDTGLDFGAVMTATCISSAAATAIMGIYARYPIAQAPGMGENFFFVFSVLPAVTAAGFANSWQVGLGIVFISGILFLALSLLGVRKVIIDAVSPSMKNAMAVGIGIFIAFIGMQNAGVIVTAATIASTPDGAIISGGTLVKLNPQIFTVDLLVFASGLLLTAALYTRKIRGAIILGIIGATFASIIIKLIASSGLEIAGSPFLSDSKLVKEFALSLNLFSLPPSIKPTFFKMDILGALSLSMVPFIIIFLFMDMFDTIGTLIGVSEQAGFIKDNRLPRAEKAFLSDAVGTVIGACSGTTTVTSFIESAAGVEQGGRTGLTSIVVALFFLLALFLSPLISMIGSYTTITAPALIVVGSMMIKNVLKIKWDDFSESIPCFLMITGIPLTYSISDGLTMGFVSYPFIKLLSGKGKNISWFMYLLAILLILYFVFVRSKV
ncbi:MAG: NCS2 family permease [Deltaproteobacteria bacterium]|nr:NCS2 family permease [Deltaproteobacteria bacterium]